MTDMKRITFAIPDDIDKYINKVKSTEAHRKESYSEIVRQLLTLGMNVLEKKE